MAIKATPYSNLKIIAHEDKLSAIKNDERTAPLYVRIKPTNVCNHHCYYCSYADRELGLRDDVNFQDQIPWTRLEEILNNLGKIGVKAMTFSGGGEPLLYPHINSAMKLVLNNNIDLSMITNGQLLNGEAADILRNAKWVRISMDASTKERYAEIRGLSEDVFVKILDNIKDFAKTKPDECELGVNFVVHHKNADQVYSTAAITATHSFTKHFLYVLWHIVAV